MREKSLLDQFAEATLEILAEMEARIEAIEAAVDEVNERLADAKMAPPVPRQLSAPDPAIKELSAALVDLNKIMRAPIVPEYNDEGEIVAARRADG